MAKRLILGFLLILIILLAPVTYAEDKISVADTLNKLGLFNGVGKTSTGEPIYDLERQPNRQEAITMLVKLLGKENEAKSKVWKHPFVDVDLWADSYVGYAYNNGLTTGVSSNKFGAKDLITANQYLTFLLKALGYSAETDFRWNEATKLSDTLELTKGEYTNQSRFTRGDIVVLSNRALLIDMKGFKKCILENLYFNNVIALDNIIKTGLLDYITLEAISEHFEQYHLMDPRKEGNISVNDFIWRMADKPFVTEYNSKLYFIDSGFVKDIKGNYYVELDYVSKLLGYAYEDVVNVEQENPFISGNLIASGNKYMKFSQEGTSMSQLYPVTTYYNKNLSKSFKVIEVSYQYKDLREPVNNYKISNNGYPTVVKLSELEDVLGDFHVEISLSSNKEYYIVKFQR